MEYYIFRDLYNPLLSSLQSLTHSLQSLREAANTSGPTTKREGGGCVMAAWEEYEKWRFREKDDKEENYVKNGIKG